MSSEDKEIDDVVHKRCCDVALPMNSHKLFFVPMASMAVVKVTSI